MFHTCIYSLLLTKMATKTIDYLYEDPEVPNQKYGLVSIVGPHMPQKCDVWGLKVRGVAETLEKAKAMTQKLMRMNNDYDIYTVEIGKFFPLSVQPYDVTDVEYQNTQLNELIKSYLENKELANEQWEQRKNDMMKQAIKEGRSNEQTQEHPVAVLNNIRALQKEVEDTQDKLAALNVSLDAASKKFNSYSDEEKTLANAELSKVIEENLQPLAAQGHSVDDIRKDLVSSLQITDTLETIKSLEDRLAEVNAELLGDTTQLTSTQLTKERDILVDKLEEHKNNLLQTSSTDVNSYINANYKNSQFSEADF
jgi:hypothetical protein